jgi:hypothetical protein
MSLSIAVPDDIQAALESEWTDLGRHLQESLAIDGFKKGLLTIAQVRRLLNLPYRFDAEQFLGSHGIAVIDFDPSELDREAQLHQNVAARE